MRSIRILEMAIFLSIAHFLMVTTIRGNARKSPEGHPYEGDNKRRFLLKMSTFVMSPHAQGYIYKKTVDLF